MKIISTLTFETSEAARASRKSGAAAPPKAESQSRDRVRVSQVAMDLAHGVGRHEPPASTDPARLEQLRAQIEDGTYPLDAERIAAAILEDEL